MAFVFLGEEDHGGDNTFVGGSWSGFSGMAIPDYVMKVIQMHKDKKEEGAALHQTFLSIPPGHAIVDPGAGQDLIGETAFERLRAQLGEGGLQPVRIEEKPASASGVGGKATTLYQSLVPCVLGGAPGVVKVTVVKEDIPHLLSIGLLESAGAIINTKTNETQFEAIGTRDSMCRLKSGHRTVDITKWDGQEFPVPEEVQKKYGLSRGAFNTQDVRAIESYMCPQLPGGDGPTWLEIPNTPYMVCVHTTRRDSMFDPRVEDDLGACQDWTSYRASVMLGEGGMVECLVDD